MVPELKQIKHPIMLRVLYKNAQLPIDLATMAEEISVTLKEGSHRSIGGLNRVCLSHQISTQLNTYGRFRSGA